MIAEGCTVYLSPIPATRLPKDTFGPISNGLFHIPIMLLIRYYIRIWNESRVGATHAEPHAPCSVASRASLRVKGSSQFATLM